MPTASSRWNACRRALAVVALCGAAAGSDQALKDKYHAQAIESLTLAISAGYRNLQTLNKDPDLDPIRDLPAFQALFRKVQGK